MTSSKIPLPGTGKLNIRHRQMRGVWQVFAGNIYILGASGDSPQEAAQELANQYSVAQGTEIKVNGYREPTVIHVPESEESAGRP